LVPGDNEGRGCHVYWARISPRGKGGEGATAHCGCLEEGERKEKGRNSWRACGEGKKNGGGSAGWVGGKND